MVFEVEGMLVLGKMEIDANVYRWVTRNLSQQKLNGHRLKSPAVSEDVKPEDAGWDKESSTTKVPTAPPSSPNPSPSKGFDSISDAQELVQAVKDMQMASAHAPKCTCSHTPPDGPSEAASTDLCPLTPCHTPSQIVTIEHVQQFLGILKSLSTNQGPPGESGEPKARASRLEFKTINEVWDEKAYKYTIEELPKLVDEANKLDQYVFVVRARIDKKASTNTVYVDIKSEWLRDVLRVVLKGVHGISAKEDKPSVEQNLLYHYLPELKSHRSSTDPLDPTCAKHLDILIQHITATYADRTRILPLLISSKITYDLL
jgi:hypothetical protein